MKNIFENAKFGDKFRTRGGRKAIYHGSKEHKSSDGQVWIYHSLMIEPITINYLGKDMIINHYDEYINDNGVGRFANLKYYKDSGVSAEYDIVSEWQEPINEEELDRLAEEFADEAIRKADLYSGLKLAFKEGYRKAKEE